MWGVLSQIITIFAKNNIMSFVETPHPKNKFFAALLLGCILCVAAFFVSVCSGCKSTEKKQYAIFNKLEKVDRKAQKDSVTKHIPAKWSLFKFPVQLTGTKTVYLPSKKIITHDTVVSIYLKKDTVYLTKTVTKNIHTTETVEVEKMVADPRPQAICSAEIRRLQTELSNQQVLTQKAITKAEIATETKNKQRGKLLWSIGLNILLALIIIAYFLRKFGILA
jgi:hypothetical protein